MVSSSHVIPSAERVTQGTMEPRPPHQQLRGIGNGHSHDTARTTQSFSCQEPKMSFPIYSGKGEWCVFWVQFKRLARRFQWYEEVALDRLVYCLRDDALEHYAVENMEVQSDYGLLVSSLKRCFGDCTPNETYRPSLQTLKKQQKETLEEYAARVRDLSIRLTLILKGNLSWRTSQWSTW